MLNFLHYINMKPCCLFCRYLEDVSTKGTNFDYYGVPAVTIRCNHDRVCKKYIESVEPTISNIVKNAAKIQVIKENFNAQN